MKEIDFTIPFEHKPAHLPEWVAGYTGQGRNGAFKAAGVTLEAHTSTVLNFTEIRLANLTSRGVAANQAVVIPPTIMDHLAVRWLVIRGYGQLLADGLAGFTAEPMQPVTVTDAEGNHSETEPRQVGTVRHGVAGDVTVITVEFAAGQTSVLIQDLFDPAKWQLWRKYA